MTALASVIDVYKFFGPTGEESPVLRGVSFDVHEGEFVCVMGPSGSGKTTLLHLISGLDQPSTGHVELAGQSLAGLNQHQRTLLRRDAVGYVFQFFNLMPNLNVTENVGLPLAIQGEKPSQQREKVVGLLEKLGLGKRLKAEPHQLSGGEMQRVSIARALAGGQPLLLCDEPTGNLSQKHGVEVMNTLRKVCDEDNRAVLLVTHNPRDAAYADRVLFLVDGQLAEDSTLTGPNIPVEDVHKTLAALQI